MKFVIDEPTDFSKRDLLHGISYSNTLERILLNSPKKAFTVGLFGEWGSGKSSIIETVKNKLESDEKNKIKFIVYDAWKYANDSFRRMFLLKIQKELNFDKTDLMNSFYLNENEDVEIKHEVNFKKIFLIAIFMIVGLFFINIIPQDMKTNLKISLGFIVSYISLLFAIFFKAFDEFKINMQKPHLFAPEQFENCFNEMVQLSLNREKPLTIIKKWVTGKKFNSNLEKIVIVIDNIDRCDKELAYNLLTDTKSFLGQIDNVIFLIPVDDEALETHIRRAHGCHKEAKEFLRKFFNVTIRIKPLQTIEIYDYANNLNLKNNLSFNPDTVDIISREYATNPRRIVQLFNNLLVELNSVEERTSPEFVKDNESLICKLLIIREEWPEYYNLICKNHFAIFQNKEDKQSIKNVELQSFLDNTNAIGNKENVANLEKIISNNQVFDTMPMTIIDLLNNSSFDEIESFLTSNSYDQQLVLNFVLNEISKGIASERFSTQVAKFLTIYFIINKVEEIDTPDNTRLQNILLTHLSMIIDRIKCFDLLINYNNTLEKQKITYLSDRIIQKINLKIRNKNDNDQVEFDKMTEELLLEFVKNSKNCESLYKVSDAFFEIYKMKPIELSKYIKRENLESILKDDLMKLIINSISSLNDDDIYFASLLYILEEIKISGEIFEVVFHRLNTIYPNFNEKNNEFILQLITNVAQILAKIDISSFKTINHFNTFYSRICGNRSVNKKNLNLIDSNINNQENITILIDFFKAIYISSKGKNSCLNEFLKVANSNTGNRAKVYKILKQLHADYNFKLKPLFKIIYEDKEYSDQNLELLKHAITLEDNNAIVNDKIHELTVQIFNQNKRATEISKFLEENCEIELVKEALINIISESDMNKILLLPKKIHYFAFDKITKEDDLFKYEDNIELLKAIAEVGEKIHKNKLVKVIVAKLAKEDTAIEAFQILEIASGFNKRNTSTIIPLLEDYINNENYKERVQEIIKNLEDNKY